MLNLIWGSSYDDHGRDKKKLNRSSPLQLNCTRFYPTSIRRWPIIHRPGLLSLLDWPIKKSRQLPRHPVMARVNVVFCTYWKHSFYFVMGATKSVHYLSKEKFKNFLHRIWYRTSPITQFTSKMDFSQTQLG